MALTILNQLTALVCGGVGISIATRRLKQVFVLLGRPNETLRLKKVIAAARARSHTALNSRGTIKYIGDYLSLRFTRQERFKSIEHHYDFLRKKASGVRITDGLTLWCSIDDEGRTHDLIMQSSSMAPMEGETELCFRLDRERLFTLTFSIVDGGIIGCDETAVVFVGGVQGAYFGQDRVRYSARKNDEIAPITILLLAVSAIADVFGIRTIVGTSNRSQVSSLKSVDGRSASLNYDGLWQRYGGVEDGRGHFLTPVSASTDVKNDVSGKHRARTRRRRKRRIEIMAGMFRNVATALDSDAVSHCDPFLGRIRHEEDREVSVSA